MPFGLQPIHLVVVAIVALLIFGPRQLPEIGRGIGKAIVEFRKGAQEMTDGFRDEVTKPVDPASAPTDSVPTSAQPAATAQPAVGKFCSKCGASNTADARFCNRCGAELAA
jgi:sec-independent protein translocase protein TatA